MQVELFQAAASNDVAGVRSLVESGEDLNQISEYGHTPLHNACITRSAGAVRALLDLGADPNKRYTYRSPIDGRVEASRTALMYTTSADVAETLLAHGAEPNTADAAGETPLTLAARRGHPEVVAVLLSAGADPAVRTQARGRRAGASPRDLAQGKIAMWRDMPPSDAIAARIDAFEKVLEMLLLAEVERSRR